MTSKQRAKQALAVYGALEELHCSEHIAETRFAELFTLASESNGMAWSDTVEARARFDLEADDPQLELDSPVLCTGDEALTFEAEWPERISLPLAIDHEWAHGVLCDQLDDIRMKYEQAAVKQQQKEQSEDEQ
jgi:hypothetical protein